MTDNVIPFNGITRLDVSAESILEQAKGVCAESVVVLGYDEDGEMYFASSAADGGAVLWLLECAKLALMTNVGEVD